MNVKIILSNEDYTEAMARLSSLMSLDPVTGSDEDNELGLLALVIADFEQKKIPSAQTNPIESILFRMDQMGISRKDLIPYIGSASKVSEVLSRKRPLSLPMIRRLSRGLGIPADILIEDSESDSFITNQESETDYSNFPLKEMSKRGCFGDFKGNGQRLKDYAEELVTKFMRELLPSHQEPAFLRAPLHRRGDRQTDARALLAWRMCVVQGARKAIPSRAYRPNSITPEWLHELAKLSTFEDGPKRAMEHLARFGITLVIERHFKGTFLDGAAMLDNGRPIVALTLRHDRIDNFWFVLLHELAHVATHLSDANPVYIDDLDGLNNEQVEREADEMAQEALIPKNRWDTAKAKKTLLAEDVVAFAGEIGVHPAIVAGRLRHDTKKFQLLSRLIGKTGQISQQFSQ